MLTDTILDEARLQELLLERSSSMRHYLDCKIPRKLRARISAEDVLQEVWIAAFRSYRTYRECGADSFDRWLHGIMQHRLLNAIKTAAAGRRGGGVLENHLLADRTSQLSRLFQQVASPEGTPSSVLATSEALMALQVALAGLPEPRRKAVWMHFMEGQSCKAIADALGRSEPAVSSLLFRGLRQLRERLGDLTQFFSAASGQGKPVK